MKKIIIGSRESKLAIRQTQLIIDEIQKKNSEISLEMLTMKTTGDIILDRSLDKIGGKGLFVKELDKALLSGKSDLSVHSLKDMPMEVPKELPILAYSKREDPRDVLVFPEGVTEFNPSLPVGCSSKRRMLQFQELYPQAEFKPIRGNIVTRLAKLDSGEYGTLILAAAGLKRLDLSNRIARFLEVSEMIPAAGQGILAIQGRKNEDHSFLTQVGDKESTYEAICERTFVAHLDGGCSSPIGAYAYVEDDKITLTGLYCEEEMGKYETGSIKGTVLECEKIAIILAEQLKSQCKERS